jgi:hypothetical protein
MLCNVSNQIGCHKDWVLMVFNVAKLGWCHKDSILMLVLTSQGVNCMSIYVGLVLSYTPHTPCSHTKQTMSIASARIWSIYKDQHCFFPTNFCHFVTQKNLKLKQCIWVIGKFRRLGGDNGQFRHNRASNVQLGMKILQKKITATQTSFSTNFGGKLSFILCFTLPERLHYYCHIYFHCSYVFNH